MALIDVVKYNGGLDEFIWKFPSDDLGTWTQLIVNEAQEALFLKDGKICDLFTAGKYVLDTKNIPILNHIINLPFGGESPFKAEVWFINKRYNLDIKWGTPSPIQLQDAKYKIFIPVRSYGQFGIRILDSKKFFIKLIGTRTLFTKTDINLYFRGLYLTKIKDVISSYIVKKGISILEINAYISELSDYIKDIVSNVLHEYGIEVVNFYINDINIPENDSGVIRLKEALAKRAEMDIVGYNYMQERSFDTLEGAAKNTGTSSNFINTGIGMAMGVGLGNTFSEKISTSLKQDTESNEHRISCVKCGANLKEGTKFCYECGEPQKKRCPKCGVFQENQNSKFCHECGELLVKKCSACGIIIKNDAKFCPDCGNKLG